MIPCHDMQILFRAWAIRLFFTNYVSRDYRYRPYGDVASAKRPPKATKQPPKSPIRVPEAPN